MKLCLLNWLKLSPKHTTIDLEIFFPGDHDPAPPHPQNIASLSASSEPWQLCILQVVTFAING